jgi:hypothetical protein
VDSFQAVWRKQVSRSVCAAGMFGKQAALLNSKPMKDLKIKGGSFDMAEQQVLQVLL